MGRTELLTCMAKQNSYGIIRDQAQQVWINNKLLMKNNVDWNAADREKLTSFCLEIYWKIFYTKSKQLFSAN